MSMQSYKADSVDLSIYRPLLGSSKANTSRDNSFNSFYNDTSSKRGNNYSNDYTEQSSIIGAELEGHADLYQIGRSNPQYKLNFLKKNETSQIIATERK